MKKNLWVLHHRYSWIKNKDKQEIRTKLWLRNPMEFEEILREKYHKHMGPILGFKIYEYG